MKKIGLLVLCGMFTLTGLGCGTIKGVGEDIGTVGGWFVKGSDSVKDNMDKGKGGK